MSTEPIQRYDHGDHGPCTDPEGPFVLFDDHQAVIAQQAQALAGAREALQNRKATLEALIQKLEARCASQQDHYAIEKDTDYLSDEIEFITEALAGIERGK